MSVDINTKYKFTTEAESIINKDWAAGSRQQLQSDEFVIGDLGEIGTINPRIAEIIIPPAFVKIIDEPLVNTADHAIKTGKVTMIKMSCDSTGRIRIYNDGPGIEIVKHEAASAKLGRDVSVIEMIFGMLHQGSNHNQDEESIVGGTNGFGAKVSNSFSAEFAVETVDTERGLFCIQKWTKNMENRENALILPLNSPSLTAEKRTPHTLISFMPDYEKFGYVVTAKEIKLFNAVFKGRVALLSTYLNYMGKTVSVYYNDELIKYNKMSELAKDMFGNSTLSTKTAKPKGKKAVSSVDSQQNQQTPQIFSCVMKEKLPWEIVAVITQSKIPAITNVNGIVVKGGKHITYITNRILDCVKAEMSKRLNSADVNIKLSDITGNVFLLLNTKIPKPSWTGQRKDVLDTDARKYSNYILPADFKKKVGNAVSDILIAQTLTKKNKRVKKKPLMDTSKIKDAEFAGGKRSLECCLIFIEGDSAKNQVQDAMSAGLNGRQRYGLFSTGGVIINVRKNCEVKYVKSGSVVKKYVKMSPMLEKSDFFKSMLETTGLNPQYDYVGEDMEKQLSELRYGYFSGLTDQDYDGKGQIMGLLISMFECLWPELIKQGRLMWKPTYIVRAYPRAGGKVLEYLSEAEAEQSNIDTTKYEIKRYKGLASHGEEESINMFSDLTQNMISYVYTERSRFTTEAFYGKESAPRKQIHSNPLKEFTKDEELTMLRTQRLSVDDMLNVETAAFQSDNIARKLDHIIDGQNQAGRKILDGIIHIFGAKNKLHRVADLAALITKREDYHHGADGLADSIKHRGFIATGGRQLPFLDPDSMFGTRLSGGHDGGSPRYIFCQLNKRLVDLLFPTVDYNLLPFGSNPEPEYFVPVLPMAVLESSQLPGTGWKMWSWARDVFTVIENVKLMIRLNRTDIQLSIMPPCRYKGAPYEWKGRFVSYNGKDYSVGCYHIIGNVVTITELPLMVWTQPYKDFLAKMELSGKIKKFTDRSEKGHVEIDVKLIDVDEIKANYGNSQFDPIEDFLSLYKNMEHQLNFYDVGKKVKSVKTYDEVVKYWFPVRRDYYGRRVDREILLKKFKIKRAEEMLRYMRESFDLGLQRKTRAQIDEILTKNNFIRISASLDNPGNTPTDKLEELVFGNADYKYLLNIKDYQKSEESIAEFEEKLSKQRQELERYIEYSGGIFKGSQLWLDELDEITQVIKEGQRTKWKFNKFKKFTFG